MIISPDKKAYIRDNIIRLRYQLRVTQEQLGLLIDVDRTTICHYEAGRRTPNASIIRRLVELGRKNNIAVKFEDLIIS